MRRKRGSVIVQRALSGYRLGADRQGGSVGKQPKFWYVGEFQMFPPVKPLCSKRRAHR